MSILRASVLGAIDGIITSFAIISSGYASETDIKTILAISLSSLVADATSMGVGEYLSSNAEHTTSSKKLFELKKQIKNDRTHVFNEFSNILKEKGVKEYRKVTSYLLDTPDVLISLKGVTKHSYNAFILGFVCFFSFLLFGSVPILFFYIFDGSFVSSIVSSLCSLSVLGLVEFKTRKTYVIEVLLLSTVCGFISYYVAVFIDNF
tara:strand:+ start:1326 stop:1943 length:618 start_codon:yes stop_codon:yes gene_type:complete